MPYVLYTSQFLHLKSHESHTWPPVDWWSPTSTLPKGHASLEGRKLEFSVCLTPCWCWLGVELWEDLGHGPRDGEAQYEVLGTVWACSGVPGPSRMPETSGFYLVLVYLGTHGCLRNVENGLGMHRLYLARGWGEKDGSCSGILLGGVLGLGLTWWQIWLGAQRGPVWEISGGSVDKDLLCESLWWKMVKKGSPCLSVFIRFSFKFQILSPFHISS